MIYKYGGDLENLKEAKIEAEKILRDQRAKREAESLIVSKLDQKMMDNLINGGPPKMTDV